MVDQRRHLVSFGGGDPKVAVKIETLNRESQLTRLSSGTQVARANFQASETLLLKSTSCLKILLHYEPYQ